MPRRSPEPGSEDAIPSTTPDASKLLRLTALVTVALAAFLVYANSLGGGFVWDDRELILGDRRIISGRGLGGIFTQDFFSEDQVVDERGYGYYRPLVNLTYAADFRRSGTDPLGFHLTNVLLHASCSVLVVLLLAQLGTGWGASGLAGLLFAIHPIHTENVAWIAGRTDLVAFLLCGLALWGHLYLTKRNAEEPRPPWSPFTRMMLSIVPLVLFAAALLAKEMSVVLVFWLGLIHGFRERPVEGFRESTSLGCRRLLSILARLLPYLAVLSLYLLWRFWWIEIPVPGTPPEHHLADVFLSIGPTLLRYLGWLTVPIHLSAYVQNPYVNNLSEPRLWLSWLALVAMAFVLWRARDKRLQLFGSMLALSFLPILNFVRVAAPPDMGNAMAERFCYFPSFPFLAIVAVVVSVVAGRPTEGARTLRWPRSLVAVAVALVVVLMATASIRRNRDWRNERAFLEKTLSQEPGAALLWTRLAKLQLENGEHEAAEKSLERASRLYPGVDYSAQASLALAQGRIEDAIPLQAARARAATFGRARALNNLAFLYIQAGQLDPAQKILEGLLDAGKGYALVHSNLAGIHALRDDIEEARRHYSLAFSERPDNLTIAQSWIDLEKSLGNTAQVKEIYDRLLELFPDNSTVLNNRAALHQAEGELGAARELYTRALDVDPDYASARFNLAQTLYLSGRHDEALIEFRRTAETSPESQAGQEARKVLLELGQRAAVEASRDESQ